MKRYEYRVIAAPQRGEKLRGLKTTGERFAQALMGVMNELGRDGWEYIRADTLPCDERSGLTGTKTTFQNMLVFRRELGETEAVAAVAIKPISAVTEAEPRRLGAVRDTGGAAPALGPAKPELAAE